MADDLDNTFHFSQSSEDKFDEKRNHQYKNYEIYDGEENIGGCLLKIKMNEQSPRGEGQIYPDSWFVDENSDILKPVVELVAYDTTNEQGKGYGRKGLQEIYKIAQEMGAEGRIEADAAWGAGAFYEHCGFEMPEALQQQNKELEDKLIAQGYSGQELKDKIFEEKGSTFDDGIRFFDPTPENLAKLNKSSNSNEAQTTLESVEPQTQEPQTPEGEQSREELAAAHQKFLEELEAKHQEELGTLKAENESAKQDIKDEIKQEFDLNTPEGVYGYNQKLFALGLGPKPEQPEPANTQANENKNEEPQSKVDVEAEIAARDAKADERAEALRQEFLGMVNDVRGDAGLEPLNDKEQAPPPQEAPAPVQQTPAQEVPTQPGYKETTFEDGSVFAQELNPNGSIKSERTTKPDGSFNFVIFHENGKVKTSIKNDGKDNFTNEKFSEEGIKIEEVSHQGEEKTRTFFNSDGSVKEVIDEGIKKENNTMETVAQEAPVQEAPVQETPVQEAPVQEAPVQEAPVQEAPVQETPAQEEVKEDTMSIINDQVKDFSESERAFYEASLKEFDQMPINQGASENQKEGDEASRALYALMATNRARNEGLVESSPDNSPEAAKLREQNAALKADIEALKKDAKEREDSQEPRSDEKSESRFSRLTAMFDGYKQQVSEAISDVKNKENQEAPAPVQEAPVQEAPVQEAPVQEAPVQEAPAPVQEAPVQEAPTPAPEVPTPAPEVPTPAPEVPTPAPETPAQEAQSQSNLNITKLGDGSVIKQEFYENGNPKGEHVTKPDGSFEYVSFHENGKIKANIKNDGQGNFTRESFSENGIKTEDVKRQNDEETKTTYNQDGSLKEVHETKFDKDNNIVSKTVMDDKLDSIHTDFAQTQDGVQTTETIQIGKEKIVTKSKEDARTILNKTGREVPPHLKDPNEQEGKTQAKEKANTAELNPLLQQHVTDKQNA